MTGIRQTLDEMVINIDECAAAVRKAKASGRYGGAFACRICGMTSHWQDVALHCCDDVRPSIGRATRWERP